MTDTYGYPATANRLTQVTPMLEACLRHDGRRRCASSPTMARATLGTSPRAGILTDNRAVLPEASKKKGVAFTYTYNKRNRLATVTQDGLLKGTYTYNGLEQVTVRVVSNSGSSNGTIPFCLRVAASRCARRIATRERSTTSRAI
jgi:YD repeat-containing protein